jgi:hypothetical protein
MGHVEWWYKMVTTLTFLHILWAGTPGAAYVAFATRRQRRYRASAPDLLQVMRDESDDSVLFNRILLIACVFSPIAMAVNELNWLFRTRSQAQEHPHL